MILAACSPEVDDPANFTVGNTNGNGSGTAASSGGNGDSTSEVADGSAGATSTTGGGADTQSAVDSSSSGAPADSGPVGNCGNGVIDAGEQCDGADLQGFDCQSLGLNSGDLACDPMMCTFDTSMCSSSTGGTSG